MLPAPSIASFQPGCPYSRQAISPLALSRAAPGLLAQGLRQEGRQGRPGAVDAPGYTPGAAAEAKLRPVKRRDRRE